MLGDYSGALPKLKDQLDNTKNDDQPLLFVAIQVLYKMHQQDKSLSPDNMERFRSYVERHQKLGGPDRAIVETWRRAVLGRYDVSWFQIVLPVQFDPTIDLNVRSEFRFSQHRDRIRLRDSPRRHDARDRADDHEHERRHTETDPVVRRRRRR